MRTFRLDGDPESDAVVLNKWGQELNTEINSLGKQQDQTATTVAQTQADTAVPPDVTGVSVSVAFNVVDDIVYNELTCTYTAPNPLANFAGVFLVVRGYRGSNELVKVAEHNYGGGAGGSASFKVNLQRTNETITCFFVAKNASEVARDDWQHAPSTTAVLNVYPPVSAPSGLTATADALGIRVSWGEVSDTHVTGYDLYRNTVNNSGTATKIATVPATSASGIATFYDKSASVNTLYFYWVKSVTTADMVSSFTSAVSSAGLGPGTHSSYRPLSNPLTGHDAGASATVNIAAFTMRIGGLDVNYNSGSVVSLGYATVYYVYLSDVNFVGGAVSYQLSVTKETILNSYGQLFVGSITTPSAGADDTIGFNDGGSGAQNGNLFVMSPTLAKDSLNGDTVLVPIRNTSGLGNDADGNTTTGFSIVDTRTRLVSGWPAFYFGWKSLKLKMKTLVTGVNPGGSATLEYSLDNGNTFTTVYSLAAGSRAVTVDVVNLSTTQILPNIQIRFTGVVMQSSTVFEWWVEGQI